MWSGFDQEFRRQLDSIRELVALRYATPRCEWPLTFVDEENELLVVREWPDGSLTAYCVAVPSDPEA